MTWMIQQFNLQKCKWGFGRKSFPQWEFFPASEPLGTPVGSECPCIPSGNNGLGFAATNRKTYLGGVGGLVPQHSFLHLDESQPF